MDGTLEIITVETSSQEKDFLRFPYTLYKNDSTWRAPLRFERAEQFTPKKNPGAPINRALFLAKQDGKTVGRIAAFVNIKHDAQYSDNTGFFGYFDCVNDLVVSQALLSSVENWLRGQGRSRIVGPSQWSVNEECGLLVEGFKNPPVMMMPYGKPYYKAFVENFGFEKATDMFAFQSELAAGYPRSKFLQSLLNYAEKNDSLTWRPLNPSKFREEVDLVMSIFNDAWSENWGFIPLSDEQISHMAKEIRPIIFKEGLWIGSIEGEPAAYIWMVPDINELTHGLDGRLLPFGWLKLLWRLKVKGAKQARIPLMGLRKKHQNTRKGLALVAQLCETVFAAGRDKGFTHCELSWILEDNEGMIGICEQASAKRYKTYRMYEKTIS